MSDGLITNWNPSRMRESVDSSKVHALRSHCHYRGGIKSIFSEFLFV